MLEKIDNAYANDNILFDNEDFDKVTFIAFQRPILACQRHIYKINVDNDNNFGGNDSDTIIYVIVLALRSKFKKRKAHKKR